MVMAKESYVEKVNGILRSDADYEQISTTTDDLNSEMKKVIKSSGEKLPMKLEVAATPKHTKMLQIYGLPKSYKPGLPLRRVVTTCDGPSRNMSIILERILNQLLKFIPAHIKSTDEVIEILKENRDMPRGSILASLGAVGLYSNIPIQESINAAVEMLEVYEKDIDMPDLEVRDVKNLLIAAEMKKLS